MSNLELTNKQREYLKTVYKRTLSIPELEIIEERLPESKKYERAINFDDLNIQTGSSKENKLLIYIHDDRWYIGKRKMPPAGAKILDYNIFKYALGLVTIEIFFGERVRGEELRSEKFLRKEQKKFNFVYLDEGYYQQFDEIKNPNNLTENQVIANDRIEESDELYPMFTPFLWDFEDYLANEFVAAPSVFSEDEKIEKSVKEYIRLVQMISDFVVIQYIFGQITAAERDILFQKNKNLMDLVRYLIENWKTMNEVDLEKYFQTKLAKAAKKLIEPRKIDISVELAKLEEGIDQNSGRSMANNVEGYLFNEDKTDFAPSLLEISRRVDKTEEHGRQSVENRFIRLLKEALKP